jgi:uncharacterized membrane protein (DUF485 family)
MSGFTGTPWWGQIVFGFCFGVGFTVASWLVGLVLAAIRSKGRRQDPPQA